MQEQRLPSIRKLAEFLGISTTPVELAYQQLIAEGFIESRPKRGYFVVKLPEPYKALELGREKPDGRGRVSLKPAAAPMPQTMPAPNEKEAGFPIYDFHLSKNDFSLFLLPYGKDCIISSSARNTQICCSMETLRGTRDYDAPSPDI